MLAFRREQDRNITTGVIPIGLKSLNGLPRAGVAEPVDALHSKCSVHRLKDGRGEKGPVKCR